MWEQEIGWEAKVEYWVNYECVHIIFNKCWFQQTVKYDSSVIPSATENRRLQGEHSGNA